MHMRAISHKEFEATARPVTLCTRPVSPDCKEQAGEAGLGVSAGVSETAPQAPVHRDSTKYFKTSQPHRHRSHVASSALDIGSAHRYESAPDQ